MKILRKLVLLSILIFLGYVIVSSSVENIIVRNKINAFKDECIPVEKLNTNNKVFYSVSRENNEPSLKYQNGYVKPGAPLDIVLKLDSTYTFPIFHEVVSFTIGGHAALVTMEYEDGNIDIPSHAMLETTFNDESKEVFINTANYWENINFTYSYMVLRVKMTEDEKVAVMNQAVSMLGDPYNLSFIFNTKNSHYCSDLITKIFKILGMNLNYDGFVTTIYDLIMSNKTEIVMYKEYNPHTKISSYYGVNLTQL